MMQDSKSFLDMFIFDEPQAKMAEAKNVHPFVKNEDEFSKIGSIGALAANAMQMNKMNGMFRGDTGELSQGAQELAQKVEQNEKTGILQNVANRVREFLSRPLIPDTTVEDPVTKQRVHPDFLKLLQNRPDLRQKFNETGSIYSDM
tara:strand:+ start:302 stop:739 length:438 start_codon:yes stop_codon:yes gene_type:complete